MQSPLSLPQSASRFCFPWMFGPRVDLTFFFIPALFGLAILGLLGTPPIQSSVFWFNLLLLVFGAGGFHWGGTWFMYLDRNNLEHYKSSQRLRMIFLMAPPVILLACIALSFGAPALIEFIAIAWAVQHLVQQNVGILLLYHNHGSGEAIVDRKVEIRTLHSSGYLFTVMFFFRTVARLTDGIVYDATIGLLGLWFAWSMADYLWKMYKQVSEGKTINVPAVGFWALSILSLVPFGAFGMGFDRALLIPSTMHWFQYIGLNYVLVKTKYGDESRREQCLVSKPVLSFLALSISLCLLSLALGFGKGVYQGQAAGVAAKAVSGFLLGLTFIHYFLDAFMWRFREEYNRGAILPHLLHYRKSRKAG